MELKTLTELNRDFLVGTEPQTQNARHTPITPLVIEVGLPGKRKTPAKANKKSGAAVIAAAQPKQKDNHILPAEKPRGAKRENAKKGSAVFTVISNAIFYLAVVLILLTVLTTGADAGVPKTIFGYSYFTVLSQSMQDEIPKGSFILVKSVAAKDLNVGDTIVYMRDRNTSVTHKVIDIYENYNNSRSRGFQTKGVNNSAPDADIVTEASVVGKVVFVLPAVGAIMAHLAANVYLVFIIFGLCVIISFCLRGIFAKPAKKKLQKGI